MTLRAVDAATRIRPDGRGESVEMMEAFKRAFETIATQLRRADGVDRGRFREQTGFELDALLGDRLGGLVSQRLLVDDGAGVRLTRRGKCVADGIIAELMKSNPGEPGAQGSEC